MWNVPLVPQTVVRDNGGQAQVATADVPLDLLSAPFAEGDGWLIVRVGGKGGGLFPVVGGHGLLQPSGTTPETFWADRVSGHPWVVTNPIFIDADGDGQWH